MKRILLFIFFFSLVFCLLFSWYGPHAITYWFKPPVAVPIDCTPSLEWAMNRLIRLQIIGACVGGFFGLVSSLVFRSKVKSS